MESLREIINETFFENSIWQYLLFMGSIVAGIILGKISSYIFKNHLRKLAAKSKTKFDDYLIDIIEEPLVLLLVTAGVWVGTFFLTLNEPAQRFFDNLILVLLTLTVTWFVIRLLEMLLNLYVEPLVSKSESKLDDQVLPILRKSIKTVIILLSVIVILSNLGYDILSILAGLGIGGLALALAAQDAVKNIIGGISIFWDKPFQIADWVEINGKSGSIHEVGLRSTRVRTVVGTTVVIPNSSVANAMLENFSTRTARRIVVNIGLTYDTSTDKMEEAMKIIKETIMAVEGTNQNDIVIRFVNFVAYSLDLEIVYWITDMSNWKMIIHQVNMGIKRNLDNAKIDMAFPTETHYVIKS